MTRTLRPVERRWLAQAQNLRGQLLREIEEADIPGRRIELREELANLDRSLRNFTR